MIDGNSLAGQLDFYRLRLLLISIHLCDDENAMAVRLSVETQLSSLSETNIASWEVTLKGLLLLMNQTMLF
jgi:hypothetical protein